MCDLNTRLREKQGTRYYVAMVCSSETSVRKFSLVEINKREFCEILRVTDEKITLYICVVCYFPTADVVGHFALELKKVDKESIIVRAARAKLSAKNQKISFRGMDEMGPVRAVLNHGEYFIDIDRCPIIRERIEGDGRKE